MKKIIYALILLLVVSGLVFANREIKNKTAHKASSKPFSMTDKKAGGEDMKKWEASAEGKKAHTSGNKIMKQINACTNMAAVVTSLSRPSGSLCGFGLMVRIKGEAYIVNFWPERSDKNFTKFNNDLQPLKGLKVNDKIVIRSHSAGYSPNYPYLIISGDYVERNNKILFNRNFRNGGS